MLGGLVCPGYGVRVCRGVCAGPKEEIASANENNKVDNMLIWEAEKTRTFVGKHAGYLDLRRGIVNLVSIVRHMFLIFAVKRVVTLL